MRLSDRWCLSNVFLTSSAADIVRKFSCVPVYTDMMTYLDNKKVDQLHQAATRKMITQLLIRVMSIWLVLVTLPVMEG